MQLLSHQNKQFALPLLRQRVVMKADGMPIAYFNYCLTLYTTFLTNVSVKLE